MSNRTEWTDSEDHELRRRIYQQMLMESLLGREQAIAWQKERQESWQKAWKGYSEKIALEYQQAVSAEARVKQRRDWRCARISSVCTAWSQTQTKQLSAGKAESKAGHRRLSCGHG